MEKDRTFYERRLREELERASAQADEGLRALHRRWASLYRERLAKLDRPEPSPLPLPDGRLASSGDDIAWILQERGGGASDAMAESRSGPSMTIAKVPPSRQQGTRGNLPEPGAARHATV